MARPRPPRSRCATSIARCAAALLALAAVLAARPSGATVYTWRDDKGALHFANDEDDVPHGPPGGVQSFTRKAPVRPAEPAAGAGTPAGPGGAAPASAEQDYERGLAAGVRLGEEQLRTSAALAQAMREPAQPVVVPYAAPPPVQVSVVRSARIPFRDDGAWDGNEPAPPDWYWGAPYWGVYPSGPVVNPKHGRHGGQRGAQGFTLPGGSLSKVGPGLGVGWMGR